MTHLVCTLLWSRSLIMRKCSRIIWTYDRAAKSFEHMEVYKICIIFSEKSSERKTMYKNLKKIYITSIQIQGFEGWGGAWLRDLTHYQTVEKWVGEGISSALYQAHLKWLITKLDKWARLQDNMISCKLSSHIFSAVQLWMCVLHFFFSFPIRWVKLLGSHICFAYLMICIRSRMRLGEKQWNTIQTKTKTTKVNAVPFSMKLGYVHCMCADVMICPFCLAAVAEEKFKEVMDSYEAIKLERQNGSCWANSWGGTCILAFDTKIKYVQKSLLFCTLLI